MQQIQRSMLVKSCLLVLPTGPCYVCWSCLQVRVISIGPACRSRVMSIGPACWSRVMSIGPACRSRVMSIGPACWSRVMSNGPACWPRVMYIGPACRSRVMSIGPACSSVLCLLALPAGPVSMSIGPNHHPMRQVSRTTRG